MAHYDDKSLGTQENFKLCLNHIERIIRVKSEKLNGKDNLREIPRFEGGKNTNNDIKPGIAIYTSFREMNSTFSISSCLQWFELLLASLDCFTWTFSQQLLPPESLFKDTNIFKALDFFISNVSTANIDEVIKLFKNGHNNGILSPKEINDYNHAKCTAIVRVIDFVTVMLSNNKIDIFTIFPTTFWCEELWTIILASTLYPESIGFIVTDIEVIEQLPTKTEHILHKLKHKLPIKHMEHFSKVLGKFITSYQKGKCDLSAYIPFTVNTENSNHLFLRQLFSVVNNLTVSKGGILYQAELSPLSKIVLSTMFSLADMIGIHVSNFLEILLDNTEVKSTDHKNIVSTSMLFLTEMKYDVAKYINDNCEKVIPKLLPNLSHSSVSIPKILIEVVEIVGKDKNLRKGSKVTDIIFSNWSIFESWCENSEENSELLLNLLTKMFIISSKVVTEASHPAHSSVVGTYFKLLSMKSNLTFKGRVLDLLPFFCQLPDLELSCLSGNLEKMAHRHFQSFSLEVNQLNPKGLQFKVVFGKLLSAMELSSSIVLFEFISKQICCEDNHICCKEFQSSLIYFMNRIPKSNQKDVIIRIYQMFISESFDTSLTMRKNMLELVCLPLLETASLYSFKEFFCDKIKEVVGIIQSPEVKVFTVYCVVVLKKLVTVAADISQHSKELLFCNFFIDTMSILMKNCLDRKMQLVYQIGCCKLIEILYVRLPKDEVSSTSSLINQKYCCGEAKTGKELTTTISTLLHVAKKKKVIENDSMIQELRRIYHCSAYNAFMAVIMRTQTEMKFYKVLLFTENVSKDDFLWSNIIDLNKKYVFSIDFETPLARKKKFSSIRDSIHKFQKSSGNEAASLHYLTSQYLAESSLNEVVAPYDFSSSNQNESQVEKMSVEVATEQSDNNDVIDYVDLEMDELNKHECMASMSNVLQHMQLKEITPKLANDTAGDELPAWMVEVHKKFNDSSTHTNTKLFIAKLIFNNQSVFKPYAKFWIIPLMTLITTGCLGSYINYFIVDIVTTILSWAKTAIPEVSDIMTSSSLLEFLIVNCYHEKRPIFRNNLEIIKTIVECWKERLNFPLRIINDLLKSSDPLSRENSGGIQILGILLSNDVQIFNKLEIPNEQLSERLARSLTFKHKEVYGAASEVIGMSFKQLDSKGEDKALEVFMTSVEKVVLDIISNGQIWDRVVVSVYGIHKHFPQFSSKFLQKFLFKLPSLRGMLKTLCLEVIYGHAEKIDNVFQELKTKDILGLLKHRDDRVQLTVLLIIQRILKNLSPDQLLYLLPSVISFSTDNDVECRKVMTDILMALYQQFREHSGSIGGQVFEISRETLLSCLGDSNEAIR
ncbi:DNA-dependent protein kinase catalytic subunit [Nymphon striatum]|nr:DNA-dependent protein kinase catalytic subunit [Nymphon striatum]